MILDSKISIEGCQPLYFTAGVKINRSWQTLTDTATIELPRNIQNFSGVALKDIYRTGKKVKIELGYNGSYNEEYTGYIRKVATDIPVQIYLDDEMYWLKQVNYSCHETNGNLREIINSMIAAVNAKFPTLHLTADIRLEADLGTLRYTNNTVAEILKDIREKNMVYSYFRNGVLIVGMPYLSSMTGATPRKIDIRNLPSPNLEYVEAEAQKLKVKIVSTLATGKTLTHSEGEDGGEVIEIKLKNVSDLATIQNIAKSEFEKKNKAGYTGSITVFGNDFYLPLEAIEIVDSWYPERQGIYKIDSTEVEFKDTFKRILKLGKKVS